MMEKTFLKANPIISFIQIHSLLFSHFKVLLFGRQNLIYVSQKILLRKYLMVYKYLKVILIDLFNDIIVSIPNFWLKWWL